MHRADKGRANSLKETARMQPTISTPDNKQELHPQLHTTSLRFKPGQMIFDEGQKANRWYEVVRGTVRTCRFHIDGHRHLTGFYFGGDVFGADYGYYNTAAEAVTNATVRCYRVGELSQSPSTNFSFGGAASILYRAMSSAQRYLFIMGHRTALEKLAAFLLSIYIQDSDDTSLNLPMSRADIADFLGLTVHTVSRSFSELVRREYIKIEGRHVVVVKDCAGLCRLAGEHELLANECEPKPTHSLA